MNTLKQKWLDALGAPSASETYGKITLISSFSREDYDAEWYRQENGADKYQRVLMLIPKNFSGKLPAVAVPFYYPEAMLGFNPETNEILEKYKGIEMMLHLVKRGYIVASAESYHLTYIDSKKDIEDFSRWQDAADALRNDNPNYRGVGKLIDDTKLLINLIASDKRVDSSRIGIAGHSLGGKMAFYTGCLDDRISAILANDFGFCWHQTNWDDDWYWGDYVKHLKEADFEHYDLLSFSQKPFCLIAGEFDTDDSYEHMLKARGYDKDDIRLKFINHKTGHRPPMWALQEGYDFLDFWLKS